MEKYKRLECVINTFTYGEIFDVQVIRPAFDEAVDKISSLPTKGPIEVGRSSHSWYYNRKDKRISDDHEYWATHVNWKYNRNCQYK